MRWTHWAHPLTDLGVDGVGETQSSVGKTSPTQGLEILEPEPSNWVLFKMKALTLIVLQSTMFYLIYSFFSLEYWICCSALCCDQACNVYLPRQTEVQDEDWDRTMLSQLMAAGLGQWCSDMDDLEGGRLRCGGILKKPSTESIWIHTDKILNHHKILIVLIMNHTYIYIII